MRGAALKSVDLLRPDGTPIPGLVSVREADGLSIAERTAVVDAQGLNDVDYVFFRRFNDQRSSHVAAYVVENSDERHDEQVLAQLHLKVWLQGKAPLLYIAWPSRIDVLSCARGPDFWKKGQCRYEPASRIELEHITTAAAISDELRRFSAFRLADGTFWDDPLNEPLANYKKAAHQSLIQAIVEADKELDGAQNPAMRRLLLLMVLIKYLEDRSVFPNGGWFGRYQQGAKRFFDVLQGGEPENVKKLLAFLENKFNGDIFAVPDIEESLTRNALERFADLVEGRTLKRQRYLWDLYSFKHLPVEVISSLYQRFVHGGHGAVYTPPFLASLLLDHAMPYDGLSGDERVLDPACGSGVFLVGAYRRLINVWRSKNDWRKPNVATLKHILTRSIHGIELDPFAVDLTAFSLSLAVCDALQPDVIWSELKFSPLRGSNLFEADFFEELLGFKDGEASSLRGKFDVIVGNPPFESELTPAGKKAERAAQRAHFERGELPDNQAAYLFLEQSIKLLSSEGCACLIQPSGLLYNRKTASFRRSIMQQSEIKAVLDFVSIRGLFEGADTKAVAVIAKATSPPSDHVLAHWTFRRTATVKDRICFELDHYDRHRVPQALAENDPCIWRVNLLGGGRLLQISQRLRQMRTLAEFISEQDDWDYGEGFIVAKSGHRTEARWLTGMPLLPTDAFTEAGIDESRIETVTDTHFRSAYTEERYSSPLLLLKETEALPIAYWDHGPLAYRHEILGIHAPRTGVDALSELFRRLSTSRKILRSACLLHGGRALVGRATAVLKQDIDFLPHPEKESELEMTFWEDALCQDILEHFGPYVRLGQESKLLTERADEEVVRRYSSLFLQMLGTIYGNLQSANPIFLGGLICQPFYFGERPELSCLSSGAEEELRKLIYDENRLAFLRTIRMVRFYSENAILLVKPDRLRYWIRSTAIRDADDTLVDLRHQGY